MNKTTMSFDIPVIDNRKAALALHLGVDSENDRDWDSIIQVEIAGLVDYEKLIVKSASVFEFQNARYYVDHISSAMESDLVIAFNSNFWKIKKAPTSAIERGIESTTPWSIKDPTHLPATMRQGHGYDYLNYELNSMWLDGLSVAHQLLERHEEKHGHATYYQDSFGHDYIAALADPRIGTGVGIVYDEVADHSHSHLPRKEQPSWQAFEKARLGLKLAPRGSIALLRADDRWHIRIHAGGGYVSDCKTMRCTGPKPIAREIQECVLSYEAFLARKHAEKERQILRNFTRLRELKLQPGQTIRDVELQHNGKRRSMNFTIQSITDTGYIMLVDGRLRGSPQRFTATIAACDLTSAQVLAPEPNKAVAAVDMATEALF